MVYALLLLQVAISALMLRAGKATAGHITTLALSGAIYVYLFVRSRQDFKRASAPNKRSKTIIPRPQMPGSPGKPLD